MTMVCIKQKTYQSKGDSVKFFQEKESTSCSMNSESEGDNCCTPQLKGKVACPSCGEEAKGVLGKTLNALLKEQIKENLNCLDGFHYCKTATCKTIYFRDETLLTQDDMIVVVGLKEGATPATICYCFGWTKEKIKEELMQTGETVALADIKAKMEDPGCSCEILNPSGGCCLGDTGKAIKEIKKELGL